MPPVNDNLTDRIVLTGVSGSIVTNNIGATRETGEATNSSKTVWFEWTAPDGVDYVVFDNLDSTGSEDTVLIAWEAAGTTTPPPPFVDSVGYNDDSGSGGLSRMAFEVTPGTTYWISLGSFGSSSAGTFLLKWEASQIFQPEPVGAVAGRTTMLAIGDMGAHALTGWAAAVVSSAGGTVSLGPIAEIPVMTPLGTGLSGGLLGYFGARPYVARLTDTTAVFIDHETSWNTYPPDADDTTVTWMRILTVSGDTVVPGPAQLIFSDPSDYAFQRSPGASPHWISGNAQYVILADRGATSLTYPFNYVTTTRVFRIESDLSFTVVDTFEEGDYAQLWIYPLDDGTFAYISSGIFPGVRCRILTLSPDGMMSFSDSIDVLWPSDGHAGDFSHTLYGFEQGIPTVVPGTRKILLTSNLYNSIYPDDGGDGDDIGCWLVDVDTGEHGAVSRFYAGSFVPYGANITLAGRTNEPGTYGLLTAPELNEDIQRIVIRPFTISGNDMVFSDDVRVVMSQKMDDVGIVQDDVDYGFGYQYDGGLFVGFHQEFNDYPFARIIAQPIDPGSGAGYTEIFLYDDDDIDDRDHWWYTSELMSLAPPADLSGGPRGVRVAFT